MMIEKAEGIVANAIGMFKTAIDEIDAANKLLDDSKKKSEDKIEYLKREMDSTANVRDSAAANIQANIALKEKLSQFVR